MITVQGISEHDNKFPIAITIGTFDGVHIGHRKILDRLISESKLLGLKSMVLTFFPHPRMVLQKDAELKLLNTLEEKKQILHALGLDYLLIHPFTKAFSRLTADEFVEDILSRGLNTKRIIIGYDHRFGRNRNADINDLKAFGKTFKFDVEEISAQEIDEVAVSSTKIRLALEQGDIKTANRYLGYAYMLSGIVTRGKGLGRQLHFPTANLAIPEPYKLIPKNGVYVVRAEIQQQQVYGMMNIGFNPTVAGTEKTIEIHFFGIDEDLYNRKLQIQILDRIRDEHRFESVEALKKQLAKDKKTALSLLEK
ncbi:bifunctional riboflavin kinase/FAD synthetase [Arenibacter sp. GZD96]|uniref:bifunctional riboflavin kinase/FAD synthetase n=1 Tax=Aurantibrevibacter litoralis TaxID=3106030 RepID=UPI002AFFCC39|nr:bifunctional riboflavin kinase/FAD synthetase [Arenibacter sp. GZD-96]MEA1786501.1 bifunctional riboflavin kinase/FAD synthetase [Arenibacter sp. GZD-96]